MGRERKGFNGKYRQESPTADKELFCRKQALLSFSVQQVIKYVNVKRKKIAHVLKRQKFSCVFSVVHKDFELF